MRLSATRVLVLDRIGRRRKLRRVKTPPDNVVALADPMSRVIPFNSNDDLGDAA